ncbi:hypothetical protein EXIGLDRAFT_760993 [Exidia glandulosa HHB12029]|uniref:Uncharacterized protein n=1 Tax=Exidia glandulosa HHB12029 TaxID=1314781 RepID=A0A165NUC7_EXIGL|nr:hypothetical protein EXIGLDRAFT_760993 [Exidia glandulosa HHB12029]
MSGSDTILFPLSSIDQAGVETSASVFGYVLAEAIDTEALRLAAFRVIEKWRLLAGTVEWANKTYNIRVPLGPISHDRLRFTTSSATVPLGITYPTLADDSAAVLNRPPLTCFRHKDTPNSLSGHAKNAHPIISIHVSVFVDFTCVGISCSHGVLDGTGQGMFVRFLDDELHGRPWSPPSFSPANLMQKVIEDLNTGNPLFAEEPAMLANLKREFPPLGAGSLAAFAGKVGYEYFWHKAEDRGIFLGRNVVEKIVADAKRQNASHGRMSISTADILIAWVVKTIYEEEELYEKQQVALVSALSIRSTLAKVDKGIESWPHNAVTPCCSALTTQAAIKNGHVADLAYLHREAVDGVRTVPYMQSWIRHISTQGRPSVPARRRGVDVWTFTNQVLARPTEIDFGVPIAGFFYFFCPLQIDHTTVVNKLNGGYMLNAMLRAKRWEAIERAVQRLQVEHAEKA